MHYEHIQVLEIVVDIVKGTVTRICSTVYYFELAFVAAPFH